MSEDLQNLKHNMDTEEIHSEILENNETPQPEPEPEPVKAKLRVKKPRTQAQKDALAKGRAKLHEKRQTNKQMKTVETKQVNRKKLVEKYDMDEYINEQVEKKLLARLTQKPKEEVKEVKEEIQPVKSISQPEPQPKDLFFSRFFPK
jgi:hypothetical protein